MIRQIAASTGQYAQVLRAHNWRRFYAPSASLTGARTEVIDDLGGEYVCELEEERRVLHAERIRAMREEVDRGYVTLLILHHSCRLVMHAFHQQECFNLFQQDLGFDYDHQHHPKQDDNLSNT